MESKLSRTFGTEAVVVGWILTGLLVIVATCLILDLETLALGIGSVLSLILITRFFRLSWMLLIVLLPFSLEVGGERGEAGIGLTLPTEALIALLLAGFVIRCLMKMRIKYTRSALNPPLVLFVLICLLSLFSTAHFRISLKALARDFAYLFCGFYLATQILTTRKRIIALLLACLVSSGLLVVYGLGTQLAQGGFKPYQQIASPFFKNHCIYAAFVTLSLSLAIAFALGCSRYARRALLYAFIVLVSIGIILSFVRGAWLSLAGMLLFYAWVFRRQIDYRVFAVMLFAFVLLVVILIGLGVAPKVLDRVGTMTDTGYSANFDRLDRWASAWRMYLDNPILGVGYGTYADRRQEGYVHHKSAYSSQIRMGAHNLYLEILAETGILGLLAFLWLVWRYLVGALRILRHDTDPFRRSLIAGSVGAMITFLTHALVNNLGPSDKIFITFWFLLALVPIASRLRETEQQADSPVMAAQRESI